MNRRAFLGTLGAAFAAAGASFLPPVALPDSVSRTLYRGRDGCGYVYARACAAIREGDVLAWASVADGVVRPASGSAPVFAGISTADARPGQSLWVQVVGPSSLRVGIR